MSDKKKDNFCILAQGNRGRIENYMQDMSNKEVAMNTDKEQNVLSKEDDMIMILVG